MYSARRTVIVLDDHPLVARGIAHYVQSIRPDLLVLVTTQWQEFLDMIETGGRPELVVTDIWLAGGNVLDHAIQFRQKCPHTPWLAISGDEDPSVAQRMRAAGAQGFVHKRVSPELLAKAVSTLLNGGQWFDTASSSQTGEASFPSHQWVVTPAELGLTPRQGEILALVLRGLPNKRIALALGVAESTVKEHITGILETLQVRTRVEVITLLSGKRLKLPADE